MTVHHILDTVFRAGVFRAMHGVSPLIALAIAIAVVASLYFSRRKP